MVRECEKMDINVLVILFEKYFIIIALVAVTKSWKPCETGKCALLCRRSRPPPRCGHLNALARVGP